MIGALGLRIDEDVLHARHEVAMQEGIVEERGDRPLIGGQQPAMGLRRQPTEASQRIDGAVMA